jgi:MFS family permease
MGRRIPRNVLVVAFVALASGFGQDLITPVLPGFLVALGVSRAGIGLVDGLLQGTTAVFRFVSGIASDRLRSRKGLVFLGYALSSVARPLLALAGSFGSVAALRAVDGVGKGTKDAPRDALVADSSAAEIRGRAFGFQRFIVTSGSVLGPLTAAAILLALTPSLATYRLIFALAAIPGAVALGLIAFGIREKKRSATRAERTGTKLPAAFWIFTLGTTVAMFSRINDSLFLVRAGDAGIPTGFIPVLFGGFTLLYAVLSYPIGIWSDKVGRLPLIVAGWLTLAVAEFGFSFFPSVGSTLFLFALFGLFYALTEGSGRAIIADFVPSESRGTAYAIFYSITGVAVIAGGYGSGKLWDLASPATAFHVAALGSLLGAVILLAGIRKSTS